MLSCTDVDKNMEIFQITLNLSSKSRLVYVYLCALGAWLEEYFMLYLTRTRMNFKDNVLWVQALIRRKV